MANAMNGAASSNVSDVDVCASSVCTADYPCQKLGSSYTCRGQFADWAPAYNASSFVDNGDGTVTDKRSGLVWQQNIGVSFAGACAARYASASVAVDACTWEQAKSYCASLRLTGTEWRLPTRAELESIVDTSRSSPALDVRLFPDTLAQWFWSSSAKVNSTDSAWFVDFSAGSASYKAKSTALRVRCVR